MSTVSTFITTPLIDNVVELPYYDKERVVGYLRTRFLNDKLYTWVGNVLLCVQPFKELSPKDISDHRSIEPSVESIVDRVWFRLNYGIGKRDQAIVVSGDSGSGKTYSACLAIRAIAQIQNNDGDTILRQAWASVPLLSAFGNAPTHMNTNSSRFGKLLRLQYIDGKLRGAMVETYLIEKSRVSCVNYGEGNFHIFRQILDSLDDESLSSLYLSKSIMYRIAPRVQLKSAYAETIKSMETLNIGELNQILKVLSIILNLGNVGFQENTDSCHGDGHEIDSIVVSPDSKNYLANAAKLFQVSLVELAEVMCSSQFSPRGKDSVFKSPCMNIQDCEARRDCIMKHLYERLFRWLVTSINYQIFQGVTEEHINLLDLYGFEVFDHNTFEQLCINYANERMQHYFTKSYLLHQRQVLLAEGYQVDNLDDTDYVERISLFDGCVSIFGILNEECAMKRIKSHLYLNTRLGQTFRNHKHFFINDELETFFSIRHYAGVVKYDTTSMIAKNRDKVPNDVVSFLKRCGFNFVRHLMEHDKELNMGNNRRTVLGYFKSSFDKLIHTLEKCDVHYVKCLKPNNYKIAEFFDQDFFAKQLRCNGIFEIMKLSFQNYPIKIQIDELTRRIGYSLHEILKKTLGASMHVGKRSIFMTEECFTLFQRFGHIRRNQAARTLQRSWLACMERKNHAASVIQNYYRQYLVTRPHLYRGRCNNASKTSNCSTYRCDVEAFKKISTSQKVEEYLNANMVEVNNEGMALSLQLEKLFYQITTKKFKRVLFLGDRIVSYSKLAEVPIRFHLRKTCIRYSHLLPKSELSNGLTDVF